MKTYRINPQNKSQQFKRAAQFHAGLFSQSNNTQHQLPLTNMLSNINASSEHGQCIFFATDDYGNYEEHKC